MIAPWVLLKAADLIDERGWTQEGFVDAAGCLCIFGAVNVAQGRKPGVCGAEGRQIMLALEKNLGEWPPYWNDREGRTKDEVTALLRAYASSVSA